MAGSTESQADTAEAGPDRPANGDLGRIERGMRNLAFKLEQDQRAFENELSAVNERLDALRARADDAGAASAAQPAEQPAEAPARSDADVSRELKALRRQVAELQRAVAELRRDELGGER